MATRQTQVQKKTKRQRLNRSQSKWVLARTHTYTRTHSHGCILITFTHLFTTTAPTHGSCRSCRDELAAFPRFDTFPLIPPKKTKSRPLASVRHALAAFFFLRFFFRHARNDVTAGKIANPSPTPNSPFSPIVDGTWNRARRRVARLKRRG